MDNIFTKVGEIKLGDVTRGVIVAVIMAVLTVIYETIQKGSLAFDWQAVLIAGIGAGVAYILKNLGTGENGKFLSNK